MKLLIVDDDADHAQRLCATLAASGHAVSVAPADKALSVIDRAGPDAVLLDDTPPRRAGRAMVRLLRARGRTLPVLLLSASGSTADTVAALDAGADDVVASSAPAREIDARLRASVRGRGWGRGDGETLRACDIVLDIGRHRAWRADRPLDLTRLEFGLLAELMRNAGGFVTRATLVTRVWGRATEPATNVVDAQIRLLRRKLTGGGGADPIVTKRGVGYMLRG